MTFIGGGGQRPKYKFMYLNSTSQFGLFGTVQKRPQTHPVPHANFLAKSTTNGVANMPTTQRRGALPGWLPAPNPMQPWQHHRD